MNLITRQCSLPKISIVTPSYNHAEHLEDCIDSVLSQGYGNLEYIIIDGGSTDASIDIIKKHERHLKHWQSKPDGGLFDAITMGFKHATGDIQAYLNSDDLSGGGRDAAGNPLPGSGACKADGFYGFMQRPTVRKPSGRAVSGQSVPGPGGQYVGALVINGALWKQ